MELLEITRPVGTPLQQQGLYGTTPASLSLSADTSTALGLLDVTNLAAGASAPAPAAAAAACVKPPRPRSTRRRPLQGRGVRLYRDPVLPVCVRDVPGGATVSLVQYHDDTRDWRKLPPSDVRRYFSDLEERLRMPRNPDVYSTKFRQTATESNNFEGLIAAIVVGNLQACSEGMYWAPSFQEATMECRDIRSASSRAFSVTPDISAIEATGNGTPEIEVLRDTTPLAACEKLAAEPNNPHIALVRFIPVGDRRKSDFGAPLGDFRETQLQLRTSFAQALHDMPKHLHKDPRQILDEGAVVYTSDVTVFRGPVEKGAAWLEERPCLDVLSVAIQRHPRCDEQGQYARTEEKAVVLQMLDRVFACAAIHDVDVLVFPPMGVGGAAGCFHPAPDAGDLIRKAALAHAHVVPRVFVCREYGEQVPGGGWLEFANAVAHGRPPIEHRALIPLSASPWLRPGWQPPRIVSHSLSKTARHPQSARSARSRGPAVLGAAGKAIAT